MHLVRIAILALALSLSTSAVRAESGGLWLVRLEPGAAWSEGKPDEEQQHADETREALRSLIRRGVVLMAGRSEGAGLLVMRALDEESAASLVGALPTVRNDVHRYRVSRLALMHVGDLRPFLQPAPD